MSRPLRFADSAWADACYRLKETFLVLFPQRPDCPPPKARANVGKSERQNHNHDCNNRFSSLKVESPVEPTFGVSRTFLPTEPPGTTEQSQAKAIPSVVSSQVMDDPLEVQQLAMATLLLVSIFMIYHIFVNGIRIVTRSPMHSGRCGKT